MVTSSSLNLVRLAPLPLVHHWQPAGKLAGLDKKLSRSLEADVTDGSSPEDLGKSPMGPLSEASRWAWVPAMPFDMCSLALLAQLHTKAAAKLLCADLVASAASTSGPTI